MNKTKRGGYMKSPPPPFQTHTHIHTHDATTESSSPGCNLSVEQCIQREAVVTATRHVSFAGSPVVHIRRRLEIDVALAGVEGKVSEGAVLVVRKRLSGGTVDAGCPVHERLLPTDTQYHVCVVVTVTFCMIV